MLKISRESEINLINVLIDNDIISGKDLINIKKTSSEGNKSQIEAVFDLKLTNEKSILDILVKEQSLDIVDLNKEQITEEINKTNPNGAYWANQFDNIINSEAHIQTTAEEIWNQTAGTIDGFTCAVGTGGTLAGVSIGLKNKNRNIKIALSDPMGSSLYSHFKKNKLESTGSSITEGIGTGRITKNFEKCLKTKSPLQELKE